MGGKVSAEYHRRYRRAHPENRARQNALRNERRRTLGRGDRSREYKAKSNRRLQAHGDEGQCLESSIVKRAQAIVMATCRPDQRTTLWDDKYEDLVGEVVVALCEGCDPMVAMREWMRGYWLRRYRCVPFSS
jgi:hypothetical protein